MQTDTAGINNLEPQLYPSIPRVRGPELTAADFFEHYRKPGTPVILTDLIEPAIDWSLEYLCAQLGSIEFPVRRYGQQRYQQDKRMWASTGSGVEAVSMPFRQYAQLLRTGQAHQQDLYLGRGALTHTPLANAPTLLQAEAHLGLNGAVTALNIWVGPGGHTSCLHYDPMDGTLTQLHGAKRVILFPPSQLYNLYPIPVINHLWHGLKRRAVYSQVYPDRPDFNTFPRFEAAQTHRCEVILNRGEILFIPAGWWHEVISVGSPQEITCSVNRFWHVYPLARSLRSWSKWRAHLGSTLAVPHILSHVIGAAISRETRYR